MGLRKVSLEGRGRYSINGKLEAVCRGLDRPETELPEKRRSGAKPSRRADPDPALPDLRHARDRIATELKLDPAVVAPKALLEAVLRERPADRAGLLEVPGMRRWQADAIGDALLDVIRKSPPAKPRSPSE